MSNKPLDRTTNTGGRFDYNSKLMGGMYFSGNLSQATTVSVADTDYRIGNGNASAPLYAVILPTSDFSVNPYWEITGTTSATQALKYVHGKNGVLKLDFGLSIVAGTASNYTIKLWKLPDQNVDVPPAAAVIPDGEHTIAVSVAAFRASLRISTIVPVSLNDSFYLTLANNTGATNTTVISSEIVFSQ